MSNDDSVYAKRRWVYLLSAVLSFLSAFISVQLEFGAVTTIVWIVAAAFWMSCFHLAGRIARGEYDTNDR